MGEDENSCMYSGSFDVILGGDNVYDEDSFPQLLSTLSAVLHSVKEKDSVKESTTTVMKPGRTSRRPYALLSIQHRKNKYNNFFDLMKCGYDLQYEAIDCQFAKSISKHLPVFIYKVHAGDE